MEYIILGHVNVDVDSIVSGYLLEKIMTKKGYKASFVIPDEEVAKFATVRDIVTYIDNNVA